MFQCGVKDRDDSETSADASQSLLSQLPSSALSAVEEEKSAPVDTSVWFEQSMSYSMLCTHVCWAVGSIAKELAHTPSWQGLPSSSSMWPQNWLKQRFGLFNRSIVEQSVVFIIEYCPEIHHHCFFVINSNSTTVTCSAPSTSRPMAHSRVHVVFPV